MRIHIPLNHHDEMSRIVGIVNSIRYSNSVVNKENVIIELQKRQIINPEEYATRIMRILKQKKFSLNL